MEDFGHGAAAHPRRPLRRPARFPPRAVLRRGAGRGGRLAPDGVRRRRTRRRPGRAPAARRAELVVPLPPRDRRAGRGRHPCGGAGPGRLRPLGQADRPRGPHLRASRGVGAGAGVRRAGSARRHPGRSGLGRADRAAPGRRARGPVRPGRRRQHRPPHRRLRHARDLVAVPHRGGVRPGPRHRTAGRGRVRAPAGRGRTRGVRRAVPRRDVQGRTAGDADPGADLPRRPGRGGEPGGLGGADPVDQAVPGGLQRRRPDHRATWRRS